MIFPSIGIMQGRLQPPVDGRFQSFPKGSWAIEFPRAAEAGLTSIEWIYDAFGAEENPIKSDKGIGEMKALAAQHGVAVTSLCADYFMDFPFLRSSANEVGRLKSHLQWLLERCQKAGIGHVVLPFVDASRIETGVEEAQVIELLREALPVAEATGVEIHLETSLCPKTFAAFLARVPHPMLRVNYDSGNSASLGYCPKEEFVAYGARIGSIHIKDRLRGAGTVPLGKGDANLDAFFESVRAIAYRQSFILQVARGPAGDELAWARMNLSEVRRRIADAGIE